MRLILINAVAAALLVSPASASNWLTIPGSPHGEVWEVVTGSYGKTGAFVTAWFNRSKDVGSRKALMSKVHFAFDCSAHTLVQYGSVNYDGAGKITSHDQMPEGAIPSRLRRADPGTLGHSMITIVCGDG